jgi:hypothetical protein
MFHHSGCKTGRGIIERMAKKLNGKHLSLITGCDKRTERIDRRVQDVDG